MEDDCPQGGDDVRLSVLRTLGTFNCRSVLCVLCSNALTVYDRYPLIDGTFFLSPVQHVKDAISMKYDSRFLYLHVLCIRCMQTRFACERCGKSDWFMGESLIIGTLYTYDVLSISLCCPPACRCCMHTLPLTDSQQRSVEKGNYSLLMEQVTCSACGSQDYHRIRRIDMIKINEVQ
ncbi:hypothetical protein AB6A40_007672 [Gnathostoma spinigerum]|uniref:Headcase middle domain-containing protein n=1 Tax=Gnathostoma spinigerum TaxID=75299 RepID=A0ABD6ELW8_9BILA